MRKLLIICALFIYIQSNLQAKIFYIDPVNGDINNDGSFNAPWSTLQDVWEGEMIETRRYINLPFNEESVLVVRNENAPVNAGDTLMLRNGYHGTIFYRGMYNSDYVTFMAQPGHSPTIGNIKLSAAEKCIFDGLHISPAAAPTFYYSILFFAESHDHHGPSRDIVIKNCHVYGIGNSKNWGLTEWKAVGDCIYMEGNKMIVESNICRNISAGINLSGDSSVAINNQVINFSNDGLRGQGSYLLFEGNLVKNAYDVNENHDDAYQSFTNSDNPFVGNILRGNTIINWEDPNQPFRGNLQGIGCFDGPYIDWVIENNLIIVNHYHGITLHGAINCKIVNNTVIDIDNLNSPNGTWIRITDLKNGSPSQNSTIQNNISFGFSYGSETESITNLQIDDYQHFQDASLFDFRLVESSAARDAGTNPNAPTVDIVGKARPQNGLVDIGAYEYIPPLDCSRQEWNITDDIINSSTEHVKNHIQIGPNVRIIEMTHNVWSYGTFVEILPEFEIAASAQWTTQMVECIND